MPMTETWKKHLDILTEETTIMEDPAIPPPQKFDTKIGKFT